MYKSMFWSDKIITFLQIEMADPCVRKVTNPLPVLAPKRPSEESSGNEAKKPKTFLEDDLSLSDCDIEETQKSVTDLINIMIDDAIKGTEGIPEKPLVQKKPFVSKEFVSSDDETDEEVKSKEKLNKKETEHKEKLEKFKNEQSLKKKEAESKEKKTVIISPLKKEQKNQCRYVFVKKPKKGERCTNQTKTHFCNIHSSKIDKPEKIRNIKIDEQEQKIQDTIRELQFNSHTIGTKVDSMMDKIQNNSNIVEIKTKLNQLETKIKKLEESNLQQTISKTPKKLHKLNKRVEYKLVANEGKGIVKLLTNSRLHLVKLPKTGLLLPEDLTNVTLKYNEETKQFEFKTI